MSPLDLIASFPLTVKAMIHFALNPRNDKSVSKYPWTFQYFIPIPRNNTLWESINEYNTFTLLILAGTMQGMTAHEKA